jgi:protein phosphatase
MEREDVQRISLADADQLLLCTDGLTNMVDATTIGAVLRSAACAKEACQTLLDQALHNGGKDNITIILAGFGIPSES